MQESHKVLISTIHPAGGGVPTMLKFVIDCLLQRNYQITLAYYRPYSTAPDISVPTHKILSVKPSKINEQFYGVDCVGLGCWLPEFEVTHYWVRQSWKQLIESHDAHLVVSGSCMAALAYVQTSTPFLGWIASDWQGDRQHRVKNFPLFRRLIDKFFISPIAKKLEKRIISSNQLVALSEYTRSELNNCVDREAVKRILRMPIETDYFIPKANPTLNHQIGFVGRFEDPRKHLNLLLESFARVTQKMPNIELLLVGDTVSDETLRTLKQLSIEDNVTVLPYIDKTELPQLLLSLDLFILPSYQEGLCIAALEAMSCGIPVISTRCGGPESYIVDGQNGILCDHDANEISMNILKLYSDEKQRISYAKAARETIVDLFSTQAQTEQFWSLFDLQFQI